MTEETPDNGDMAGEIPIIGGLTSATVIYADALIHTSAMNGVMRLAFVQNRATPPQMENSGWTSHHVATIAMPVSSLKATVLYLQNTLADFQDNGWVEKDGD